MVSYRDGTRGVVNNWEPHMAANPVVYQESVNLSGSFFPTILDMQHHFVTGKKKNIKTWGEARKEGVPHWIALSFQYRKVQPMHIDSNYPRYTHHLKVRCDDGIIVRGASQEPTSMYTGLFYILDTHSPHQVMSTNKYAIWNVAVSIDSDKVLDASYAIDLARSYATRESFYAGLN